MTAAELMQRITQYGADMEGIKDRFQGNDELYKSCFLDFLEEPNFTLLKQALADQNYEQAFAAAHALKGLSGNLGITAFFDAICILVESLRAHNYTNVTAQYTAVEQQHARLNILLSAETTDKPADLLTAETTDKPAEQLTAEAPDNRTKTQQEKAALLPKKKDLFIPFAAVILLLVFLGISLLFNRVLINYQDNISQESAAHLTEINHQLKLYIEEKIDIDWKIARSVGDSISNSNFVDNDQAIYDMLQNKKTVWQVTDVAIYNADGFCISAEGIVTPNDIASDNIDKARELGEYLTIQDSDIMYTVPVTTDLLFQGSEIVAVSVRQEMSSFLDSMQFSSFDGHVSMYLTESNGIVLSQLSSNETPSVFNFLAVCSEKTLSSITGDKIAAADLLAVTDPATFMMSDNDNKYYTVVSSVSTHDAPLLLFYLAPEKIVNETMNVFSRQLVLISVGTIIVFAALALSILRNVYRTRKRQLDEKLQARDHMYDLLVKNTLSSFGLITINQEEPGYISSNTASIIGNDFFVLKKSAAGFSMHASNETDNTALSRLNDLLQDWDGQSPFKSGFLLNDKTGPGNYFEIQLYPADNESTDYIWIAQDVTQAYEHEQTTKNALEMAERSNAAKSLFLSNMSHDIRTPMNSIVNITDFAIDSLNNPKQLKGYLETIRESSVHLLRLINDVLDMSRIESGQVTLDAQPFDLKAEIRRQTDIIRPLCMAKNQMLILETDDIQAAAVCGDQLKFSQIISNLLSNAVKFTPKGGGVRLSAREIPSLREDIVAIRLTVEDNGIGIAPDYLPDIFKPFSRADDRRISKIEGTGLGLSICHSYVTAMGGTIHCESEPGEGTVFTVELFFRHTDAVPEEYAAHSSSETIPFWGKHCLVAEDIVTNQTIARTMLERLGFIVEIANDGRECVQKFLQSRPGRCDIIYMDIQMPYMDGYQAAAAIRESSHPLANSIPIIAMTANVFAEDIEKARIAGMNGHIGKPIMLLNLIEETTKALKNAKGEI